MVKQPVLDVDLGFVGVEEAGFDEGDAGHGGVPCRGSARRERGRRVEIRNPGWRRGMKRRGAEVNRTA